MNNNSEKSSLNSDELDELILDRLVDNDLSDQEYREVLRLVETKPNGWQKLALAFLESQALGNELSVLYTNAENIHADPGTKDNQTVWADAESVGDVGANDLAFDPQSQSEKMIADVAVREKRSANPSMSVPNYKNAEASSLWTHFRVALPAIVACFAIAFVAGLYVREIQDKNDPRIVDVGGLGQDTQNNEMSPRYLELVPTGMNGGRNNEGGISDGERNGGVRTPVLSHTKFDPVTFANNVNNLKPRLQQVVNQSGLQANEKTHMVPVEDNSGNRMIVPLTEIKLSPNKFEGYQ